MLVGSIKENTTLEKRVSITPESAKNIIGLGLNVCIEKDYAIHLGINDSEYKAIGAEIKVSSKEVLNSSDLITKVNCPSEIEIETWKGDEGYPSAEAKSSIAFTPSTVTIVECLEIRRRK